MFPYLPRRNPEKNVEISAEHIRSPEATSRVIPKRTRLFHNELLKESQKELLEDIHKDHLAKKQQDLLKDIENELQEGSQTEEDFQKALLQDIDRKHCWRFSRRVSWSSKKVSMTYGNIFNSKVLLEKAFLDNFVIEL